MFFEHLWTASYDCVIKVNLLWKLVWPKNKREKKKKKERERERKEKHETQLLASGVFDVNSKEMSYCSVASVATFEKVMDHLNMFLEKGLVIWILQTSFQVSFRPNTLWVKKNFNRKIYWTLYLDHVSKKIKEIMFQNCRNQRQLSKNMSQKFSFFSSLVK